ncbi:DUF6894 family protein [Salinarimonas soli]|uniref:DUF6894 domain-containing protein n=1 Tax=Salinarimonas soli TaxID=1638099 RepID=A0A5B2V6B6_9HYPH|nr:hypothetical protein [Salinarimonas soli]KAA2234358.1 hypothetical protein F0L46_23890 [Salinarimonas soli]
MDQDRSPHAVPDAGDCTRGHDLAVRAQTLTNVYARLAEAFEHLDAPPRFHFHFRAGGYLSLDQCGVELPDADAARAWAEREARRLTAPEMPLGVDPLDGVIVITDDSDRIVCEVAVRDAARGGG